MVRDTTDPVSDAIHKAGMDLSDPVKADLFSEWLRASLREYVEQTQRERSRATTRPGMIVTIVAALCGAFATPFAAWLVGWWHRQ